MHLTSTGSQTSNVSTDKRKVSWIEYEKIKIKTLKVIGVTKVLLGISPTKISLTFEGQQPDYVINQCYQLNNYYLMLFFEKGFGS
jgi:hypothetical protein